MKTILLLVCAFVCSLTEINAQEKPTISFDTLNLNYKKVDKNTISIRASRKSDNQILSISIVQSGYDVSKDPAVKYTYKITVLEDKTKMLKSDYILFSEETPANKTKGRTQIFLEIKKDSMPDRERRIVLVIEVKKNDSIVDYSDEKVYYNTLEINVDPIEPALKGYDYMAYIGTNFDLVEGINAKDLFFAGNILSKPNRYNKRSVGFYLSLYGNRAFTQIDSSGLSMANVFYEPLSDTTYVKKTTQDLFLSKRVTDNIGAYISPLIQIKWFRNKNEKNNLFLYYSPSLEFVYRRTTLSKSKLSSQTVESIVVDGNYTDVQGLNYASPNFSDVYNEFSFNAGIIALFMCLENEDISVRVHTSVGYSSNFYREFESDGINLYTNRTSDIFFSGRAWMTEPTTGITLQAEVTNTMFNPRPFFVATLSKAFSFNKLGSIFQPVVSR